MSSAGWQSDTTNIVSLTRAWDRPVTAGLKPWQQDLHPVAIDQNDQARLAKIHDADRKCLISGSHSIPRQGVYRFYGFQGNAPLLEVTKYLGLASNITRYYLAFYAVEDGRQQIRSYDDIEGVTRAASRHIKRRCKQHDAEGKAMQRRQNFSVIDCKQN